MKDLRERPLSITIAQLRHLYAHLVNGTFSDAAELATGLLSPEIQALERLSDAAIAAGVGAVPAWRPISEDTPTTGEQILVGFQGQFEWMSFVANAFGSRTSAPGYAAPTHWQLITSPAPPETGEAETAPASTEKHDA